MARFDNKVVLVTGATSGVGESQNVLLSSGSRRAPFQIVPQH